MLEWFGITGKILREQFQSQIILKRFEETFRKREKVFQVSENTAKIRDEFSGCYHGCRCINRDDVAWFEMADGGGRGSG